MKKIIFLTLCTILSTSLLVGATTLTSDESLGKHSTEHEEITPYVLRCDCGGNFIGPIESTSTNWYTSQFIQCGYNTSKMDKIEYRSVTKVYKCNKCSLSYSSTTKEYRDDCSRCNHV